MRLAPLLGGLTLASDLASAFAPGKALRTCVVAVELARIAGAGEEVARDAFDIALLRALGCTGFAHEEGVEFGAGDDLSVRSVMAMADPTEPGRLLASVVRGIAPGAPITARAVAIGRLASPEAVQRHARAQCDTSVRIARIVGASERIQLALRTLCERWDGRGAPARLSGEAIALAMRVYHVANVVEIALQRFSVDEARALLERRAGGQFDPRLARALVPELSRVAGLVASDAPQGLFERFLESEPAPHTEIDEAGVDDVARGLAYFVDVKCSWFLGHTSGVAALAEAAGRELGLADAELRDLRRAALLHDLGRVTVPNGIWERPGRLGVAEHERVRLHAYQTERILAGTPPLRALAPLASADHERLDGSGYHRSLAASSLSRAARVLAAADVAHAMREARPHRAAMSAEDTRDALLRETARGLDRSAVDAVIAAMGLARPGPRPLPGGMSERELEVLRLVARGKTNKEIGILLGISARTVQNHVAHVYDKIGVYSRAGAAMYVMENGLAEPE